MEHLPVLCSPSPEVSCFGCCPPIRPARYDHLDHVGILRRELAENRRALKEQGPGYRPIVGYHCWALGFLDKAGRRAGCLLHPGQNDGRDLRYLIDYGEKCRRESCVPARMFDLLPPAGKSFWLPLAKGLSTFLFSSPRANPLFHLLLWGPEVLEPLRAYAERENREMTELLWQYTFLRNPVWHPKGHRYLFRLALELTPLGGENPNELETFCGRLWSIIRTFPELGPPQNGVYGEPYTHLLPLPSDFLDFLRLAMGRRRISLEEAVAVKEKVEHCAQYGIRKPSGA